MNPLTARSVIPEKPKPRQCEFSPLERSLFWWSVGHWPEAAAKVLARDGDLETARTWLGAAFRVAVMGLPGRAEPDWPAVAAWVDQWPEEVLAAAGWLTPAGKQIKWDGYTLGPGTRGWREWIADLRLALDVPYATYPGPADRGNFTVEAQ